MFLIRITILIAFIFNSFGIIPAQAQALVLPKPGVMVRLSPEYEPVLLKGIKVIPNKPWELDFLFDVPVGEDKEQKKEYINRLTTYFLVGLTIPEKNWWVNLSPYEKDKIMPNDFGQTQLGRDLLAEDYLLKQVTATLIYPQDDVGKQFWAKVYKQAQEQFGTTQIPVNTYNKVWIVPQKALVYENKESHTAYVVETKLKVMLESDYLAQNKSIKQVEADTSSANHIGKDAMRELILPLLEKEVNESKNFIQLRQIVNTLALASWYKRRFMTNELAQQIVNRSVTQGLENNGLLPENVFSQYVKAYKKGVFNFVKEEMDDKSKEMIPRKYFSGGMVMAEQVADSSNMAMGGLRFTDKKADLINDLNPTHRYEQVRMSFSAGSSAMLTSLSGLSDKWLSDIQRHLDDLVNGSLTGVPQESYQRWQKFLESNSKKMKSETGKAILDDIRQRTEDVYEQLKRFWSAHPQGVVPLQKDLDDLRDSIDKKMNFDAKANKGFLARLVFWEIVGSLKGSMDADALATKDVDLEERLREFKKERLSSQVKENKDLLLDLQRAYPERSGLFKRTVQILTFLAILGIPTSIAPDKDQKQSQKEKTENVRKSDKKEETLKSAESLGSQVKKNEDALKRSNEQKQAEAEISKILSDGPIGVDVASVLSENKGSGSGREFIPEGEMEDVDQTGGYSKPPKGTIEQNQQESRKDQYFKDKISQIKDQYNVVDIRYALSQFTGKQGAKYFVDYILKEYVLYLVAEDQIDEKLQIGVEEAAGKISPTLKENVHSLIEILRNKSVKESELKKSLLALKETLSTKGVLTITFRYVDDGRPYVFLFPLSIKEEIKLSKNEVRVMTHGQMSELPFSAILVDDIDYPFSDLRGYFNGKYAVVFMKISRENGIEDHIAYLWTSYHELLHAYQQLSFQKYGKRVGPNPELEALLAPLMFTSKPSEYIQLILMPFGAKNNLRNKYSQGSNAIIKACLGYLEGNHIKEDLLKWTKENPNKANKMAQWIYDHPELLGDIPLDYTNDIDFGDHTKELGEGVENGDTAVTMPRSKQVRASSTRTLDGNLSGSERILRAFAKANEKNLKEQVRQITETTKTPQQREAFISWLLTRDISSMGYLKLNYFLLEGSEALESLRFENVDWRERIDEIKGQFIAKVLAQAEKNGYPLVYVASEGVTQGVYNFIDNMNDNTTTVVNLITNSKNTLPGAGFRLERTPFNGLAIFSRDTIKGKEYRLGGAWEIYNQDKVYSSVELVMAQGNDWLLLVKEPGSLTKTLMGRCPNYPELQDFLGKSINNITYEPQGKIEFTDGKGIKHSFDFQKIESGSGEHIALVRGANGEIRKSNLRWVDYRLMQVPVGDSLIFKTDSKENLVASGKLAKESKIDGMVFNHISSYVTNGKHWIMVGVQIDSKGESSFVLAGSLLPEPMIITPEKDLSSVEIKAVSKDGQWIGVKRYSNSQERPVGSNIPEKLQNVPIENVQVLNFGRTYFARIVPQGTKEIWYLSSEKPDPVVVHTSKQETGNYLSEDFNVNRLGQWIDFVDGHLVGTWAPQENNYPKSGFVYSYKYESWLAFETREDGIHPIGPMADTTKVLDPIGIVNNSLSSRVLTETPKIRTYHNGEWACEIIEKTPEGPRKRVIASNFSGERVSDLELDPKEDNEPVIYAKKAILNIHHFPNFGEWIDIPEGFHYEPGGMVKDPTTGLIGFRVSKGEEIQYVGPLEKSLGLEGKTFPRAQDPFSPNKLANKNSAPPIGDLLNSNGSNSTTLDTSGAIANNILSGNLSAEKRKEAIKKIVTQMKNDGKQPASEDNKPILEVFEKYQGDFLGIAASSDEGTLRGLFSYLFNTQRGDLIYDVLVYCKEEGRWDLDIIKVQLIKPFDRTFWGKAFEQMLERKVGTNDLDRDNFHFDVQMQGSSFEGAHGIAYKAIMAIRANFNSLKVDIPQMFVYTDNSYQEEYAKFIKMNKDLNELFGTHFGSSNVSDETMIKRQFFEEIKHDALVLYLIVGFLNFLIGGANDWRRFFDKLGPNAKKAKKEILKNNPWLNKDDFEALIKTHESITDAIKLLTPQQAAIVNLIHHIPEATAVDNSESASAEFFRIVAPSIANLLYKGPKGFLQRKKFLNGLMKVADDFKKAIKDGKTVTPEDIFKATAEVVKRARAENLGSEPKFLKDAMVRVRANKGPVQLTKRFLPKSRAFHRKSANNGGREYVDYLRSFVPGDDARDYDWRAWGRTDRDYKKIWAGENDNKSLPVDFFINVRTFNMAYVGSDENEKDRWLADLWRSVKALYEDSNYKGQSVKVGNFSVGRIFVSDQDGITQQKPLIIPYDENPDRFFNSIIERLVGLNYIQPGVFNLKAYKEKKRRQSGYKKQSAYNTKVMHSSGILIGEPQFASPLILTVGLNEMQARMLAETVKKQKSIIHLWRGDTLVEIAPSAAQVALDRNAAQNTGGVDLSNTNEWVQTGSDGFVIKDGRSWDMAGIDAISSKIIFIKNIDPRVFLGISS